jgi:hypothetical protein
MILSNLDIELIALARQTIAELYDLFRGSDGITRESIPAWKLAR